jgi:ADP-ribosyl-[dinitrogen reductase] hydrolase
MKRIERVSGALFGVACGDALGGTLEFANENAAREKYGFLKDIIGGGAMKLQPGEVTDDTIMTVAVAEGILENPDNPIDGIGERFVAWYNTHPIDIGIACRVAIEEFIRCGSWESAGMETYHYLSGRNAGNGSLMRCIPAALYYEDYDKMLQTTKDQSNMTHYHKLASEACALYNTIVYRYLKGEEKLKVIDEVIGQHETYGKVLGMMKENLNPSGFVVDSLICALWCFANHSNPEEIISEAVNLYGDPDTIGAIAGGLAGVYYGYHSIPERWRNKILIKDKLLELADKISLGKE